MQAMGKLYHDKSEVAPLSLDDGVMESDCKTSGSMWVAILSVLHQIVAIVYSVLARVFTRQPKLKDA